MFFGIKTMIELEFRLNGVQKLRSIFSKLMGTDPIHEALQQSIQPFFSEIRNYEAPNVPSYQRTFSLMNSWKYEIKRTFSTASIKITSDNIAAPFVRGASTQARIHMGRWKTDEQITQAHSDRVIKAIDDAFIRRINV